MNEWRVDFIVRFFLAKSLTFYENIFDKTKTDVIINMTLSFNFPEIDDELRKNKDEFEQVYQP